MAVPILVLYPHRRRFYPQHEVYGRLPGYRCTFSAPDETFAKQSRGGMDFQVHSSRPIAGLEMPEAGRLEHTTIVGLESILRRLEPRVVFTFEAFSAISFQVSRTRMRSSFKHIVLSDSTTPPAASLWRYSPTTAFFAAEVRRRADLFVAHTARGRVALRSLGVGERRIVVVPPGVDLPPDPVRVPNPELDFRVLFLGAVRRNKGVETLIEAFQEVSRRHPRTQLLIAGSGPFEPAVTEAGRRNPGVSALGWVDEHIKAQLLRRADLYVLPSEDDHLLGLSRWEEQTAISAIEAMQSGAPTVGSDSGALPEIVGFPDAIFEQRSPSDLARLVERAIEDSEWRLKLRRAQMDRARAVYNISESARILSGAIGSLLRAG